MEVSDGGRDRASVLGFIHRQVIGFIWDIERPVMASSVGEGSGDADGADRIETIGILHDLAFDGVRNDAVCSFEGDLRDDVDDLLLSFWFNLVLSQKTAGIFMVSVLGEKLDVIDIVKEA